MSKGLLLFSGGQDSTTLLGWCLKKYHEVYLITFDYEQKHLVEIQSAKKIIKKINTYFPEWKGKIQNSFIYKINKINSLNKNALTSELEITKNTGKKLPNTFVPGRNILFYTLAAAYAYDKGIMNIISGVCQTDYSGYPDCRNETILALEKSISLGMDKKFKFLTPLMKKNKSEIWKMAYNLGGNKYLSFIKKNTHTCYRGNRVKFNDWGYGCNNCPACFLRSKGWKNFKDENKKKVLR